MNRDVFICDEQTRRIHFQNIQSTMTKDSRLKVKFGKFNRLIFSRNETIKFHLVSANNAVAKARAFFRTFELKPHRDKRTLSPLIVDSPSPPNEDYQLITPPISKIDKINPRDLIVHRVINIDDRLPLNYFQQKYKQYLKPSLLIPKQYYNDLLNKRYYSSFTSRHAENKDKLIIDFYPPSVHYRPSSSSSSSSASTWEQCVRRLNTEYRLTIDALEQAKECLKHTYSQPKPSLPNKRSGIVTFNLPPPPIISDHIEQSKIPPCIKFSPPKFIKPVQLDTFPLSSALTIIENDNDDDKIESVSNIIKKFNSLSPSSANPPRVHFQPSVMTYEIPKEESIMIPVQDKQINSKKFISRIPTKINSSNKQKSSTATTTTMTTTAKTRIPIKNSRISRPSAVQHK